LEQEMHATGVSFRAIRGFGGVSAAIVVCAILTGCQPPQEGMTAAPAGSGVDDVARVPTEPNVVNVVAIYNSISPWLYDRDHAKVQGIYVSGLYLLGPKGYGVFGDGVIRPRLYVLERRPDGRKEPKLTKEWSFTVEEAIPWRGKQKRTPGWGYGLPLEFDDIDLAGREIQMIVAFERTDGRIVRSSKQTFIVPKLAQ